MNKKHVKKGLLVTTMLLLAFGTAACGTTPQQPSGTPGAETPKKPESSVTLMHVHGLGYSADGSEVYIPAHNGLAVYKQGKWSYTSGPAHDYMGFSMVDNGFYSSGHPTPDSELKNPLGIVKSSDLGKTLEKLAFYGESDFHSMGVGYHNHAIYAYNEQPNEKISKGLYASFDDAKTWNKADMKGVNGEPTTIAVHPSNNKVVAVGTENGLFLSEDGGATFKSVESGNQITSLFYSYDGNGLYVGGWNGKQAFLYFLNQGQKQNLTLPPIGEDSVVYLATNPKNPKEIMMATMKKDVYLSTDGGNQWKKLVSGGAETH